MVKSAEYMKKVPLAWNFLFYTRINQVEGKSPEIDQISGKVTTYPDLTWSDRFFAPLTIFS